MCIRDRSNATAIEAFTAVLLQLNVRYKTRVAPKLTGIKGCLLYTSDAADERSSVDLGGRRIIKKKKTDNIG